MMGMLEIINVLIIGWFVGFVSFALIETAMTLKNIKKERVRHDMEMARIKAARSVTRWFINQ